MEIKEIILEFIKKEYLEDDDVKITYDTPLISSGLIDSFSMVSLLVFIENRFMVKIPANEASPDKFDSIDKIVHVLKKYL